MSHPYGPPYDYPCERKGDPLEGDPEDQGKTGPSRPRPDSPDADLDVPDDNDEENGR